MNTFATIIAEIQQHDLINTCIGDSSASTDMLLNYIDVEKIQQRIDKILFTNTFKRGIICNIFHITYDEENDRFQFHRNRFSKTSMSNWNWESESIDVVWNKTVNGEYVLENNGSLVSRVFTEKLPIILKM